MADETGFGTFHDSEQDLAVMHQYEAFLQLQLDADRLTDEEYLNRLDQISGGDPSELLHGATAYGTDDIERMREETAVRDASELADKYGYENADGLSQNNAAGPDGGLAMEPDDENNAGPDDAAQAGDDEENTLSDGVFETDLSETAAEMAVAADGETEEPGKKQAEENGAETKFDTADDIFETAAAAAASRNDTLQEDKSEEFGQEAVPEEGLDKQLQADEVMPGLTVIPEDDKEEISKGDPRAYGGGHFEAQSEYRINDIFDSIAAGTGTLSGAIVGYEYVPEQKAAMIPKETPQMTPALAAMYREMARTDEREMQRTMGELSK